MLLMNLNMGNIQLQLFDNHYKINTTRKLIEQIQ